MTKKNKIYFSLGFLALIILVFKTSKKIMQKFNVKSFLDFVTPDLTIIGNRIGVPAKFLIAQASLETGFGKSSLFTKYYNIGGIKAVKNQPFVTMYTYEYVNGIKERKPQNFAVYPDLKTGLEAYAKVFQNKYFKKYLNKTTDPKEYAKLLQSGSIKYATDINYVSKINKIIDLYLA